MHRPLAQIAIQPYACTPTDIDPYVWMHAISVARYGDKNTSIHSVVHCQLVLRDGFPLDIVRVGGERVDASVTNL